MDKLKLPHPGQDLPQVQANIEALSEHVGSIMAALEKFASTVTRISRAQQAFVDTARFNKVLAEESSMLWWLFGEHSRDLEKPLKSLPAAGLSLIAGKDLADLTRIIPGPLSVKAMLHKALDAAGVDAYKELELGEIVNEAPWEWRVDWLKEKDVAELIGISHCLPAVATSIELERNGDWPRLARERDGVSVSTRLTQIEWALQCYYECLLLRELGSEDDDQ